jgi:hypothetical protein
MAKKLGIDYWLTLRGARSVVTNLNAISNALDLTRFAANRTFSIDKQVQTFGIQMGLNANRTTQLADTITGLSNTTGLSTAKTGELVSAMSAAGLSVGDFDKSLSITEDTFKKINKGAAENLEMMAEMTGRYGMSAAAVIKTSASLKMMGMDLKGVANNVTKWQKQYKIPGMIAQIPQAVAFAEKSMVKFKDLLGVQADTIIQDTMATGAIFAKVYGVDIGKAISMAQESQQHFMSQQATNADVFLGLSDSFSPLTNAMFEAGMQFDDIQALLKKGQKDPIAYSQQILAMKKQMEDTYGAGSMHVKRWYQLTLRSSSEQAKMLLTEKHALKDAVEARRKAEAFAESDAGQANNRFKLMTESMRGIASVSLNTFKNLLMLGKTILGLTVADKATEAFKDLHDWIKKGNLEIVKLSQKMKGWMKDNDATVKKLQKTAGVLTIVGGVVGGLAASFKSVMIPLATLKSGLTGMPLIGSGIGKMFGALRVVIGGFVKWILAPIGVIYGAVRALEDFGKALSDPNLTGPEKLLKGLRGIFVGIASAFDDLLMGIPTKIAKYFFKDMRGTLVDVVKRLFTGLQADMSREGNSTFSIVFEKIKGKIGEKIDWIWGWMKDKLVGWKTSASELGQNIGRAIGSLAKWAWVGIKKLFDPANWKKAWNKILKWWNGDGPKFSKSFSNILDGIWDVASEFVEGVGDEIALGFGSSWEEVIATVKDVGDWFKDWASWFNNVAIHPIIASFLNLKRVFMNTLLSIAQVTKITWDFVKVHMSKAVGWIMEKSMGPLIRGLNEAIFLKEKWKYIFANSDEKTKEGKLAHNRWAKARREYRDRKRMSYQTAKSMTEQAKKSIATSSIEIGSIERLAKAAKKAHDEKLKTYSADKAAGHKAYNAGKSKRSEAAKTRRDAATRTGATKRAGRAAKRENALRMGKWADELRDGVTGRTENIIKELTRRQADQVRDGNTSTAAELNTKINVLKEGLDFFATSNDPDKMIKAMRTFDVMANKSGASRESYEPTSKKPELLDVEKQVSRAGARVDRRIENRTAVEDAAQKIQDDRAKAQALTTGITQGRIVIQMAGKAFDWFSAHSLDESKEGTSTR